MARLEPHRIEAQKTGPRLRLWTDHTNELKCKHLVMDGRHVLASHRIWDPKSHRPLKGGRSVGLSIRPSVPERLKDGRGIVQDPKHAQSEEVRPAVVVVEIGCETVSHGITITTHI